MAILDIAVGFPAFALALTMRTADSLVLYAAYDSILRTGNTAAQSVSAGLRLKL